MAAKLITSRENPFYKELKHLATSSQARRKAGRSLLDGVHLCQTYLEQLGLPPISVASESSLDHPEVAALLERCSRGDTRQVVLPDALYAPISQVEHGVGLLFVVDTPVNPSPAAITRSAVLLDNLQDPGNLGSILRSAAAAGISDVFCGKGTAFAWSPKVLRAGMGAHFFLNIFENVDLAELMQNSRIPVLATSSHASTPLYEADLRQPVAWLFGHEGQGVADELMALSTRQLSIPHLGKIESLNVAASAAVCFFEQVRQRAGK
ncbi:TrmH family RNA methyltransferase [Noviherbaspirillum massiliense]|uniref:TrmH family RNA methyltransferase n=1 Tax=Noviherbaspirillum massiliense TaxID=1465823 RepID=UPI0002EBA1C7|nr:RNA methyltransferase [Noviherbaspirillum massiliense]